MADFIVTSVGPPITPDATGEYNENGTYAGQPAYERTDGAYWIWFHGLPLWIISSSPGVFVPRWQGVFAGGIEGDYDNWGGAAGIANVAEEESSGSSSSSSFSSSSMSSTSSTGVIDFPDGKAVVKVGPVSASITDY